MHSYAVDKTTIRSARERAGLTQAELADKLGMSQQGIGAIERTGRCRLRTIHALEDALEVSLRPDLEPTPAAEDQARVIAFIVQERRRRFMTQRELATRSGIPYFQVSDIETGAYAVSGVMLTAFRPVLDLPWKLEEFTPDEKPPPRLWGANGVVAPAVTADSRPVKTTELAGKSEPDMSWMSAAPCASSTPGLFDPIDDDEPLSQAWDRVDSAWRGYCIDCPLIVQCRTIAVTERFDGVWAAALFRLRADGRQRMLVEMMPVDIPVARRPTEPYFKQCGHCAQPFLVEASGAGPQRLYCSTDCKRHAGNAQRRHRSRSKRARRHDGVRGSYGPNVISPGSGPARPRPVPSGPPRPDPATRTHFDDFEAFKRSLSLPG